METPSTNKYEARKKLEAGFQRVTIALLMKIYRELHGTGAMTLETEKELARVLMPHLITIDTIDMAAGVSDPVPVVSEPDTISKETIRSILQADYDQLSCGPYEAINGGFIARLTVQTIARKLGVKIKELV